MVLTCLPSAREALTHAKLGDLHLRLLELGEDPLL